MILRFRSYFEAFLLAAGSGGLLVLAYPSFNLHILAWVALVPWLLVLVRYTIGQAFMASFVFGIVFSGGLFTWILAIPNYKLLHYVILGCYFGVLFGLFFVTIAFVARRTGPMHALFAVPFLWVLLEYTRSNFFFLALPWGLLAHSQYHIGPIIQISSITGAYGVSLLIAFVNVSIAAMILYVRHRVIGNTSALSVQMLMVTVSTTVMLVAVSIIYGYATCFESEYGPAIKVAAVQGNIAQEKKWDRTYRESIMRTYTDLTRDVARERPNLIVWPEAALPGSINDDIKLHRQLINLVNEVSLPLLLGSAKHQKFRSRGGYSTRKYSNSAFLIQPGPRFVPTQQYDKIKLLPFSEYLPLQDIVPWQYLHIPRSLGGYAPGENYTLFKLADFRFGVTICWENIFPGLVRRFVARGAQFIINIANEAHFGQSAAPCQFLSMNVFRAVENRVYIVRCANTGISCIIDPQGRVLERVMGTRGRDTFVQGTLTGAVRLKNNKKTTLYTRWGDWLPVMCALVVGCILFVAFYRSSREQRLLSIGQT